MSPREFIGLDRRAASDKNKTSSSAGGGAGENPHHDLTAELNVPPSDPSVGGRYLPGTSDNPIAGSRPVMSDRGAFKPNYGLDKFVSIDDIPGGKTPEEILLRKQELGKEEAEEEGVARADLDVAVGDVGVDNEVSAAWKSRVALPGETVSSDQELGSFGVDSLHGDTEEVAGKSDLQDANFASEPSASSMDNEDERVSSAPQSGGNKIGLRKRLLELLRGGYSSKYNKLRRDTRGRGHEGVRPPKKEKSKKGEAQDLVPVPPSMADVSHPSKPDLENPEVVAQRVLAKHSSGNRSAEHIKFSEERGRRTGKKREQKDRKAFLNLVREKGVGAFSSADMPLDLIKDHVERQKERVLIIRNLNNLKNPEFLKIKNSEGRAVREILNEYFSTLADVLENNATNIKKYNTTTDFKDPAQFLKEGMKFLLVNCYKNAGLSDIQSLGVVDSPEQSRAVVNTMFAYLKDGFLKLSARLVQNPNKHSTSSGENEARVSLNVAIDKLNSLSDSLPSGFGGEGESNRAA